MASPFFDQAVRVWDGNGGPQIRRTLVGRTDWVRSVAISADRRRVLYGSKDGTIRFWNVEGGMCVRFVKDVHWRLWWAPLHQRHLEAHETGDGLDPDYLPDDQTIYYQNGASCETVAKLDEIKTFHIARQ